MTPVNWLSNWLHSIDPTIVWIALGYLVCVFLIVRLMKAAAKDRYWRDAWRDAYRSELDWQKKQAASPGPEVTAETLSNENEEDTK